MTILRASITILVVILLVDFVYTEGFYQNSTSKSDKLWINLVKLTRIFLKSCSFQDNPEAHVTLVFSIQNCLKEKLLGVLNKTLHSDIIEITDGVDFIKYRNASHNYYSTTEKGDVSLNADNNFYWQNQLILRKISEILETHLLRIRLENGVEQDVEKGARFRRRRNNMMPFIVFGVVAMGMILIPMGFKFLTILGGKALLLAKMALILTSINGLKKVATSGLNYGLYHAPSTNPWHYDRQWYNENSDSPTIQWETHIDDIPDEQLDLIHKTHSRP